MHKHTLFSSYLLTECCYNICSNKPVWDLSINGTDSPDTQHFIKQHFFLMFPERNVLLWHLLHCLEQWVWSSTCSHSKLSHFHTYILNSVALVDECFLLRVRFRAPFHHLPSSLLHWDSSCTRKTPSESQSTHKSCLYTHMYPTKPPSQSKTKTKNTTHTHTCVCTLMWPHCWNTEMLSLLTRITKKSTKFN